MLDIMPGNVPCLGAPQSDVGMRRGCTSLWRAFASGGASHVKAGDSPPTAGALGALSGMEICLISMLS